MTRQSHPDGACLAGSLCTKARFSGSVPPLSLQPTSNPIIKTSSASQAVHFAGKDAVDREVSDVHDVSEI